jgi:hypothetical protein
MRVVTKEEIKTELANTRPVSAPPNAPTTTITRMLAEAKPLMRDNVISWRARLSAAYRPPYSGPRES